MEPTHDDPRDVLTRTVDDLLIVPDSPLGFDEVCVVATDARTQLDRLAAEVA